MVGSPYSILDYRVDTTLGGDAELAALRQRLADLGMRLMLDFVPNHLACDHRLDQRSTRSGWCRAGQTAWRASRSTTST